MTRDADAVVLTPRLEQDALERIVRLADDLMQVDWEADGALARIQALRAKVLNDSFAFGREQQVVRVCGSVMCDVRAQGWLFEPEYGRIIARPPIARETREQEKARIRAGLLIDRDHRLRSGAARRFVRGMEQRRRGPGGRWVSIFSLMRDGSDLSASLHSVLAVPPGDRRERALNASIDPYVQVVDDSRCEQTGLLLKDVWRYFRYTWVSPSKTVPGRNMWLLVRDRAADFHPVIGIAALASPVVQSRVRDRWIGWTEREFLARVREDPEPWARWLSTAVSHLLAEIYARDFVHEGLLSSRDLKAPHLEVIERLRYEAARARRWHQLYPDTDEHKRPPLHNADWKRRARTYLFRSKRADALADVLAARLRLLEAGFTKATGASLTRALAVPAGRRAVLRILRRVKAAHVGIDMLDISVCGAIPPYSDLLGGKLVSLLTASPEVALAYETRYGESASLIASSMAGRAVRRSPRLVLLGTTSLYGVGSSQYNRIRVPATELGGAEGGELRYCELGLSEGFGSFHFSDETVAEMEALLAQNGNGRRVNSIFGEGVSPHLRKMREALDITGMAPDGLLNHRSRRIVYGVPLATNFRDVLLGREDEPNWIVPRSNPSEASKAISGYWTRRWLAGRIERPGVLERVASHRLKYPVTHGARVRLPEAEDELSLFSG